MYNLSSSHSKRDDVPVFVQSLAVTPGAILRQKHLSRSVSFEAASTYVGAVRAINYICLFMDCFIRHPLVVPPRWTTINLARTTTSARRKTS